MHFLVSHLANRCMCCLSKSVSTVRESQACQEISEDLGLKEKFWTPVSRVSRTFQVYTHILDNYRWFTLRCPSDLVALISMRPLQLQDTGTIGTFAPLSAKRMVVLRYLGLYRLRPHYLFEVLHF